MKGWVLLRGLKSIGEGYSLLEAGTEPPRDRALAGRN